MLALSFKGELDDICDVFDAQDDVCDFERDVPQLMKVSPDLSTSEDGTVVLMHVLGGYFLEILLLKKKKFCCVAQITVSQGGY